MLLSERFPLLFIGLLAVHCSFAQIDRHILPLGFHLSKEEIATLAFHSIDASAVSAVKEKTKDGSFPKMGSCVKTDIDLIAQGEKKLIHGEVVYLYHFKASGAKGLVPYFDAFHLTEGAALHIYSPDRKEWLGAFTKNNNGETGSNTTGLMCSDEIIFEYKPGQESGDELHINEMGIAVRMVPAKKSSREFGDAASCEVNVNCPEGAAWQNQKRAVVRLLVNINGSIGWCSGTLINNTKQDCTPYLLTADHCGGENGTYAANSDFAKWLFYFNYESPNCNNPSQEDSLGDHFMTGSKRIAYSQDNGGDTGSDFLLVKLNKQPDSLYTPYFAGWNHAAGAPDSGVCIHHPNADIKKISRFGAKASSKSWGGSVNGTHWEVSWVATQTGYGITEEGSSGSPIFNYNKQIVGTLTGGNSFCNTPTAPDDYGKFYYHWDKNDMNPARQLKPWLDSLNTGVTFLDGRNQCTTIITPNGIDNKLADAEAVLLYPNPSTGNFVIQTSVPSKKVSIYSMDGKLIEERESETQFVVNGFPKGIYLVKIQLKDKMAVRKVVVE